MKPEELLMQYYQYWTQPTDGPAHIKPPEDHDGTIEAFRIGAEAIVKVERLRAENTQLKARFPQYTCHVCWTTSCEPVETEDECILEHPHEGEHLRCLCCSQTQWLKEKNEHIAEAIREVERLRAELAKIRKHWRKPTHGPCCTCQRCGQDYDDCRCSLDDVADELEKAQQRIAELERTDKVRNDSMGETLEELDAAKKRIEELEKKGAGT